MSSPGTTNILDRSGNGKGVAINIDSLGTFHSISAADRAITVINDGRVVYDTTTKKLYLGDGVTVGGKLITSA
jgi:hypothetical protein